MEKCSSLFDVVPLQVSARLVPQPVAPQPVENDSDDDDQDPDYDPLDETEYDEDSQHGSYTLRSHAPLEGRQCLLFRSCLAEIPEKCEEQCEPVVQFTRGTMIGTVSTSRNGHTTQWESPKCHHVVPWSNLLLTGNIVIRRSQVPANTQTS